MIGFTWDQWVAELVRNLFWDYTPGNSPDEIAMLWHVGHLVRKGDPDWDAKYAARFAAALERATAEMP
jgi:hypothetical protein